MNWVNNSPFFTATNSSAIPFALFPDTKADSVLSETKGRDNYSVPALPSYSTQHPTTRLYAATTY